MKIFGHKIDFFLKYWFPSSIMIVNDGLRLWHVAQLKISTWHINCILVGLIYIYIYIYIIN
jgi:hypothetical protein